MNDLEAGDSLVCDESNAERPRHDFGADYAGLGPRFVRFHALVDRVAGDYIEATVTRTNGHLKAPDIGANLALSTARTLAGDRWSRGDDK